MLSCRFLFQATGFLTVAFLASQAAAQLDFERPPIDYHHQPTQDPIARLQAAIDAGEATLEYDEKHGYLPAVLKALEVPQSSQMLVFSKTSFQLRKISPQRPRAIYFNDNAYLGYVQNGDVLEVSAVDPQLGAVFYTLSQEPAETPRFVRDRGECLACHASSRTQGVPGHLVRSVFTGRSGQPQLGAGSFTTDHRSPFEERWGGWYVSGTHGALRHMGNVLAEPGDSSHGGSSRQDSVTLDREAGANVTDLQPLLNVDPYLEPTSDIVALMVLEHQTQMHNLLTLASYEARSAAHYDQIMNEAFDRPADTQSESTQRRIAAAGEKVLAYLLFGEEFQLTSPVTGVSSFTEDFAAGGVRDGKGRSLRDFDLQKRLFKYPCSYLIYSPSFDALPIPVKAYLGARLREVLTGKDQSDAFAHLSPEDRGNIWEILQETKPELFAEPAAASVH